MEKKINHNGSCYCKNNEVASRGLDRHDFRLNIGLGMNVISAPAEITIATSLVNELPQTAPLLAEDWIAFLERLLFEFSFALQLAFEPLNSTSIASLLMALNEHPLLKEKEVYLKSLSDFNDQAYEMQQNVLL